MRIKITKLASLQPRKISVRTGIQRPRLELPPPKKVKKI